MAYPGTIRCSIASTVAATPTGPLACRDGFVDSSGKCVTNCGPGKYGKVTFTSRGV